MREIGPSSSWSKQYSSAAVWAAWQSKGEKPSIKLSRPKPLCKGGTSVRVPSPEPGVGLQMASMLSIMHKLVLVAVWVQCLT